MNIRVIASVLMLALQPMASGGQTAPLPIDDLLNSGATTPVEKIGLLFRESLMSPRGLARSFANWLASGDSSHGWEQFAMTVYSPSSWIQLAAARAKEDYRVLTAAEVSDDMLRPVLRVFVKPPLVTTLVVRDVAQTRAVHPTATGFCDSAMPFGRNVRDQGCQSFQFSLDEVDAIRQPAADQFLITIRFAGQSGGSQPEGIAIEKTIKVDRLYF